MDFSILQPTRVTDNTATVIDNIFSNNIQDNIICGNILLTLSEHFSQFLSVKRENVDLKEVNIYRHDYSTFLVRVFVTMSQFKTGLTLMTMYTIHLMTFIINLKDLLTGMLP